VNGIFITGTGTDVGKTIVSAWLCHHGGFEYWKPIQTGAPPDSDTRTITELARVTTHPEAHVYKAPVSPHLAARLEGQNIALESIAFPETRKPVLVEGAGGLLVPINIHDTMADLIRHLEMPVIIVASSGLGTINHTCLTLEVARDREIEVLGVIMNGERDRENSKAIEHYGKACVLDELEPFAVVDFEGIRSRKPSAQLVETLREHA
jgi:dethiobiotin synthase